MSMNLVFLYKYCVLFFLYNVCVKLEYYNWLWEGVGREYSVLSGYLRFRYLVLVFVDLYRLVRLFEVNEEGNLIEVLIKKFIVVYMWFESRGGDYLGERRRRGYGIEYLEMDRVYNNKL